MTTLMSLAVYVELMTAAVLTRRFVIHTRQQAPSLTACLVNLSVTLAVLP
jgi:hypothetical protein